MAVSIVLSKPIYRPAQYNRLSVFIKSLCAADSYHNFDNWSGRVLPKYLIDSPSLVGGFDRCIYQQHGVEVLTIEYAYTKRYNNDPVTIETLREQGPELAQAIHDYLFDAQHWVSESGSDSNDGSKEYPWRTVTHAISQVNASSILPHVINVAPGTYSGNINMKDYIYLQGSGRGVSVIQAASGNVVQFDSVEGASIDGFTIDGQDTATVGVKCIGSSPKITNNLIQNGEYGIQCETNSAPEISDNLVTSNRFFGIACTSESAAEIFNNLIFDNSFSGAAFYSIYAFQSAPILRHNTIDSNDSPSQISYAVYNSINGDSYLVANNVTNNGEYGIYRVPPPTPSNPSLSFDNCWGHNDNYTNFGATPGPHEISVNPYYVSGPGGTYYLDHSIVTTPTYTPCVDAGPTPFAEPVDYGTPTPFAFRIYTTSINEERDSVPFVGKYTPTPQPNPLDIGFHYKMSSPTPINTPIWTVTPTPTETPTSEFSPTPSNTPTTTPTSPPTETPTSTPTGPTSTPTITPTPIVISGSIDIDFEDPINLDGWEVTGLWHVVSAEEGDPYYSANGYGEYYSWARSIWYGQESTGDYDTGFRNWGYVHTPLITLSGSGTNVLRFWSWEQVEPDSGFDSRSVYISDDGGNSWFLLWESDINTSSWNQVTINLSNYAGHDVILSFFFDTWSTSDNNHRGWYVDDIEIESSNPPPLPAIEWQGIMTTMLCLTALFYLTLRKKFKKVE